MNEEHATTQGRWPGARLALLALSGAGLLLAGVLIGSGLVAREGGPGLAEANVGPRDGLVLFGPDAQPGAVFECAQLGDKDVLKNFDPAEWSQATPVDLPHAFAGDAARSGHFEVFTAGTPTVAIERVELGAAGAPADVAVVVSGCGTSVEEARAELERAIDAAVADRRISAEQAQRLRADMKNDMLAVGPIAQGVPDGAGAKRVIVLADRESGPTR